MKSRKKRVYSLLSSALIFSSFGYVSGMENNEDRKQDQVRQTEFVAKKRSLVKDKTEKTTLSSLFHLVPGGKGNCSRQMSKGATPFDYTVMKLVSITNYFIRSTCKLRVSPVQAKFISSISRSKAELLEDQLRGALSRFEGDDDDAKVNRKYVDIWYEKLITTSWILPNDSSENLTSYLSNDEKEFSKFLSVYRANSYNPSYLNDKKGELSNNVRKLGLDTQNMINEAMQKILKILIKKDEKRQNDGEKGIVNGIKCEFKIFEEE